MRKFAILVVAVCLLPLSALAQKRDSESARRWHEDLAYLLREAPRRHANLYHNLSPAQFQTMVHDLDSRIENSSDAEIIVGLARIVASLGVRDGHSRVNLFNPAIGFHFLPVSFYQYSDGLFVRAAARDNADLAGMRVISIGGTPAAAAFKTIQEITPADNAMSRQSFGALILSVSEALRVLGVAKGAAADPVTIEVENAGGVRRTVAITPVAPLDNVEWVYVSNAYAPMYRRYASKNAFDRHAATKNFWYEYDEPSQLLYVNYANVADQHDETVEAFFNRVFAFADAHPVRKFVIDIRNNSGGNNYLNRPILNGLMQRPAINREGTLFAIISRETFSAAQNLANNLELHTHAIFVGEPTGGSPNHFGDPLPLILPNSKVPIGLSSVWWQDVDPRDQRLWTAPQVAAELSSTDERNGVDPALDAVRAYQPEASLFAVVKSAIAGGREKIEEAAKAWRAHPRHKFVTGEEDLNYLAVSLLGSNQDQALTIFELNAQLNPDSWLAHNSLGRMYASLKRRDDALREFDRALQLRPNAPETLSAIDRL